jgi:predicted DNA-binding transcriptional regulator YafY
MATRKTTTVSKTSRPKPEVTVPTKAIGNTTAKKAHTKADEKSVETPAEKAIGKTTGKATGKIAGKVAGNVTQGTTRRATQKVEKKVEPKTAQKVAEKAPENVPEKTTSTTGKPKASASKAAKLTPHAEKILRAISENKAVELIFLNAGAFAPRNFEPRSLSFDSLEQAWFVWGWDRRYNADRHHRLDTLAEIKLVNGLGRSAQGPFPDHTPPNHIGGWLGGDPITVVALLSKQWSYSVRQAPAPFPTFVVTDAEDGRVRVSFTATDFRAISRWCMQFGDGIQVVEPNRLLEKLKQVGTTWGAKPQASQVPQHTQPPHPTASSKNKHSEPSHNKSEHDSLTEVIKHQASHERHHQKFEEADTKSKPSHQRVEVRVERL